VTSPSWKLFVLGRDKSPLRNCLPCHEAGPEHDREICTCLTCHGFYAATADPERIAAMQRLFPENAWAVRTGEPSGIIVIDAEGRGDPSGVDVLDSWETWTGHDLPPTAIKATTPSGGVHLYYRWEPGIRSRNRVLPGIDIKSDGGYVVIPWSFYKIDDGRVSSVDSRESGRRWVDEHYLAGVGEPGPALLGDELREWLRAARGRSNGGGGTTGHATGYDYERFCREGCPGGMRDEFFNEVVFRLRKSGVSRADAHRIALEHWRRVDQPPDAEWYMPWHHVEYKLERVWRTVSPDTIEPALARWAAAEAASLEDKIRRVGRVTLT